jgi:hypothetical protein
MTPDPAKVGNFNWPPVGNFNWPLTSAAAVDGSVNPTRSADSVKDVRTGQSPRICTRAPMTQ